MDRDKILHVLEATGGNPALLALATVDLGYSRLAVEERELIKCALLAAAVPHWCNPAFLGALLAVDLLRAELLHGQLCGLKVVEPFQSRGVRTVAVHESARLALREYLRQSDPEWWRVLAERARKHVGASTSVHARIEALYHQFAIDQEAAATQCEVLDHDLRESPEGKHALALMLSEFAAVGWLNGSAQVQAQLIPLQLRISHEDPTRVEPEAIALVKLAEQVCNLSGLASAHTLLGNVYQLQGRFDAALSCFQASLKIIEDMAEADPSNTWWQHDLAVAQSYLGDVYQRKGCLDAALASFQVALAILAQMSQADPSNHVLQRELAVTQTLIGDVFITQGRLKDAETSFQQTLASLELLSQNDPVPHKVLLSQARQDAQQAVTGYCAAVATAGAIPFGAAAVITPIHLKMVDHIASCFQVSEHAAETILGSLGASVGSHAVADFFMSFVPGPGTAIKVSTAASVTLALGIALIDYFQERSPLGNQDIQN
jgi:uncharacterized protein (DUF697 family)